MSGSDVEDNWLRPSRKLLTMRRAELAVVAVVLGLGLGIGLAAASPLASVVALAGVLIGAGVAERLLRRRWRSWGYCERAADLLVRRGVLFQRLTVVPYGRMQLVDVTAGAVERVFKLQTVRLHTAAAATDARIPGLTSEEATRLRDHLASLGEAQATGI